MKTPQNKLSKMGSSGWLGYQHPVAVVASTLANKTNPAGGFPIPGHIKLAIR